jgi:hypothetical protein
LPGPQYAPAKPAVAAPLQHCRRAADALRLSRAAGGPTASPAGEVAAPSPGPLIDLDSPAGELLPGRPSEAGDALVDYLRFSPLESPAGGYGAGGRRDTYGLSRFSVAAGALPGLTPSPGAGVGRPSLMPGQAAPSPAGGFESILTGVVEEEVRPARDTP